MIEDIADGIALFVLTMVGIYIIHGFGMGGM